MRPEYVIDDQGFVGRIIRWGPRDSVIRFVKSCGWAGDPVRNSRLMDAPFADMPDMPRVVALYARLRQPELFDEV